MKETLTEITPKGRHRYRHLAIQRQIGRDKRKVLDLLARGDTVKEAAGATGISHTTIYDWRKSDPAFAKAWAALVEERKDLRRLERVPALEDKLYGQALKGGVAANQFLLRAYEPETFNVPAQIQHSGQVDNRVLIVRWEDLSPEEQLKMLGKGTE